MIIDKTVFPKTKLKFCATVYGGSTPKSDEAEFWDGEIVWVTPTDLSKRSSNHIFSSKRMITGSGLKSCSTVLVPKNSIVLSTRAPIGSIGIAGKELCTNQGCKSIICNTLHYKFLFFYLEVSTKELNELGTGTTFLELSTDSLINFLVPFPDFDLQRQIATYLNRETAKIDKLIAKQQKLIKLLQEKRKAVISQAVTKGLDPNVKMKDSGVEWLGEVPEHWLVNKLGRVSNQIIDGTHFTPTYVAEGVPFLRVTDITNRNKDFSDIKKIPLEEHLELIKRCRPRKGDLLVSKNGTIGVPRVIDWDWDFSIFVSLCLIKPSTRITSEFLELLFLSSSIELQIKDETKQSTVNNLHLEKIRTFVIPLPPIEEQIKIVDEVKSKLVPIDEMIELAKKYKSLSQESRQALITAAVTGKIDVRGLVTDEEVAALDAEPELETTEEDFASDVVEDSYITEEE